MAHKFDLFTDKTPIGSSVERVSGERVTLGPVDQMCEDRLGEVSEREEREKRKRAP